MALKEDERDFILLIFFLKDNYYTLAPIGN
jgi:hypothetical protein